MSGNTSPLANGRVEIRVGDCRDLLRAMPEASVHTVVTSPPYFGLRDYGVDRQIGLEATPAEFLSQIVDVFREVRRVLRDDGTCWVNMGDSYVTTPPGNRTPPKDADGAFARRSALQTGHGEDVAAIWSPAKASGLPNKSLLGMPWRLAFALQDDGWILRQDIIWAKPNPMPESTKDRCTKAHEYLFLFSKRPRYHYDAEAIREAGTNRPHGNGPSGKHIDAAKTDPKARTKANLYKIEAAETRNKRSVWTVAAEPFSGAHFATYPPKLIEPCILAGAPHRCCAVCGAPWERQTEREVAGWDGSRYGERAVAASGGVVTGGTAKSTLGSSNGKGVGRHITTGFAPTCACDVETVPGVVLDPFGGAGTTGLVAARHGRRAILLELNPAYAEIARDRIAAEWCEPSARPLVGMGDVGPLFSAVGQ